MTPARVGRRRVAERRGAVWHTPDGDRVLTAGEWALVGAGLGLAWDAVEIAARGRHRGRHRGAGVRRAPARPAGRPPGPGRRGPVRPGRPGPPLTAATEGALAAVFALLRAWLETELEGAGRRRDRPRPRSCPRGRRQARPGRAAARADGNGRGRVGAAHRGGRGPAVPGQRLRVGGRVPGPPARRRGPSTWTSTGSTRTTSWPSRMIRMMTGWRRPAGPWPS